MSTSPALSEVAFRSRWDRLARAAGLDPAAPVLVALSGGADSVFLLHLVAAARPRPQLHAVHVEHGLRGEEGRRDAEFCARLCRALAVPFSRRRIALDAAGPSLEARAREARYAALSLEARRLGVPTVLTGHHADDALETLTIRWLRGSSLGGLSGPARARRLGPAEDGVAVVRPLLAMRREEVRRILADHGIAWREDSSNQSAQFTRNRVRNALLPAIEAISGAEGIANLHAFARAVETFEDHLASATAHLAWSPPRALAARRSSAEAHVGGAIPRGELMRLLLPLRRRALWRLLCEGTGRPPKRRLLALVLADLGLGRSARHTLPGGWRLWIRADRLELLPPADGLGEASPSAESASRNAGDAQRQLELPFPGGDRGDAAVLAGDDPGLLLLEIPGLVRLPDGRALTAELVDVPPGRSVPRSGVEVELDARGLDTRARLAVRTARAGDRFHALGAPGAKRLTRFLADAGVPREERGRVPLVFYGTELIWVSGIRPCDERRVVPDTTRRLRLCLHGAAPASPLREPRAGGGLFGISA